MKTLHACEWAHAMGVQLKLSGNERLGLWQLARRAASKGFCWPSLDQLMEDTGLARATLVLVLRRLAELTLIRIEKVGKRHHYHLDFPVQNKTDHQSKSEPVHRSKSEPRRSRSEPVIGSKTSATGSNLNPHRFKFATLTLKEPIKEPMAPPTGDAGRAGAPEPENKISDSGKREASKEGAAALPVPPAPTPEPAGGQAPMIGQPPAEGGKPPGDPFDEGGGDTAGTPPTRGSYLAALQRRHGGSRTLHCEIEGEVLQGEVLEPEPVGPKATMGLVRSVGRDMRHFALAGVGPVRTVEQQLEIVSPLHAQNPVRTVAQQYAEVLGISLAEAEARLGAIGAATEAAPA